MPDLFSHNSHMMEKDPAMLGHSEGQDFAIVKINCSWSKTMSISSMLIADLRAVNQESSHSKLSTTLKNLNTAWDPKDIMPPYIDTIANFFPANIMRKQVVLTKTAQGKSTLKKSRAANVTMSSLGGPRK